MARLRGRAVLTDWDRAQARLELLIGPVGEVDAETLELVWQIDDEWLLAQASIGRRPWGWWRFERREDPPPPDVETVRLGELGVLRPDEFAALHEQATEARLRIGTPAERISGSGRLAVSVDRAAVALYDAVSRHEHDEPRDKGVGA